MCIIAVKQAGVELPAIENMLAMYLANRDGAGFMYARGGKVHIRKGFMNLYEICTALDMETDIDDLVVIHFRYATSGGVSEGKCHPFPVVSNRRKLTSPSTVCDMGMVHNGVLHIRHKKNESDTMAFVRKVLASDVIYNYIDDRLSEQVILSYLAPTGSRIAVMTPERVKLFGVGWIESDGIIYSNDGYIGI